MAKIPLISYCHWLNNSPQKSQSRNRWICYIMWQTEIKIAHGIKGSNHMAWRQWDYPDLSEWNKWNPLAQKPFPCTGTPLSCLLLWYQNPPLPAENKSPCVYFLRLSDRQHLIDYVTRHIPWGCWVCQRWSSIRNVRTFLLAMKVVVTTFSFQGPMDHVSILLGCR